MPYLLMRHKVEDFAAWKPVFDDHSETRAAFGSKGGQLFRNAEDPNEIILLAEVEDLDRIRELLASDDLRQRMQEAGVSDQPDVYLMDLEENIDA